MLLQLFEQTLNGIQFGVMLFLIAAGLTLVFGIMNLINIAHGVLYMIGAYICASVISITGSFWQGFLAAIVGALVVGVVIEVLVFRRLYYRTHLDQVLATFGVTMFFNELVRIIWGPTAIYASMPSFLAGHVEIIPGAPFPIYRLTIIGAGLAAGLALYLVITYTRLGMLIRAGASNRAMIDALGVNIKLLYTVVFGIGAALAGFAGLMAGPLLTVESGMGNDMLILALVVITIGGVGSIRGALVASLMIGVIDAMGRSFLRPVFSSFLPQTAADAAAPAIASMLIYLTMALVLIFRPQGLFPPVTR
ncbi:MAG TPA: branched-chain amino acid ABC transporter permease [Xanthobacteraceae bacterium]|nr:branched-chain amino acid ABC transporter permease [Xanthobacteraceae bacterium]